MTSLASALSAEPRRYPAVINIHGFARLDAHCLEKQRILRCSPAPKRASSFILDPQRPPKLLRCCRNQSSNSACRFHLGNGYAVRSEERRVGKEGGSTCSSRRARDH